MESRTLPPIDLTKFDGNYRKWPEVIDNFKICVHNKATFTESSQDGEIDQGLKRECKKGHLFHRKQSVLYVTALKTLKKIFGNPVVITHQLDQVIGLGHVNSTSS